MSWFGLNLSLEDDKVSLDELQEKIAEFEDHVQSSDVAAMQSKVFITHWNYSLTKCLTEL